MKRSCDDLDENLVIDIPRKQFNCLKCHHCHHYLKDPWTITSCLHSICGKCLDFLILKKKGLHPCPSCGELFDPLSEKSVIFDSYKQLCVETILPYYTLPSRNAEDTQPSNNQENIPNHSPLNTPNTSNEPLGDQISINSKPDPKTISPSPAPSSTPDTAAFTSLSESTLLPSLIDDAPSAHGYVTNAATVSPPPPPITPPVIKSSTKSSTTPKSKKLDSAIPCILSLPSSEDSSLTITANSIHSQLKTKQFARWKLRNYLMKTRKLKPVTNLPILYIDEQFVTEKLRITYFHILLLLVKSAFYHLPGILTTADQLWTFILLYCDENSFNLQIELLHYLYNNVRRNGINYFYFKYMQHYIHLNDCVEQQLSRIASKNSAAYDYFHHYFLPHYQSVILNYLPNADHLVYDLPSSLHTLHLTTKSIRPIDLSLIQNLSTLSPLSQWIHSVPITDFATNMLSSKMKSFLMNLLPQHFQYSPQFLVESILSSGGFYDPMLGYEDTQGFLYQISPGLESATLWLISSSLCEKILTHRPATGSQRYRAFVSRCLCYDRSRLIAYRGSYYPYMKLENKLQASALKDQINLVTPSLPQYTQERITTITQQLPEILHEIYRTPHTQLSSNHDLSWLYLCRYFIHCYPMYEPTSHSHTLLQQQPGVGIGYLDKSLPFLTHAYGAEELEGDQEKLTQSIAQGSVCWRPKEGMELQKQYDIMMTNDEDGDSDIEDS